ncbi:hypothetical protein FRC09_004144 [Ceratobasidium sp. 395]|nr:hypothetical protein FRC09_004144 [Ceratobasidium sp. 395]
MEAVLPMALNPDEKRIVRHQGTSVVIGRSGTGKTTALVYKLRANAQAAAMLEGDSPIRQLFVTRSRVLTQHIARNYQGLLESSEIANKSREELAEIRQRNQNNRKRELVEFDNEVDLRDDLPDRFSLLRDSHFPLFVSFDKLCSLLEADIESLQEGNRAPSSMIDFTNFKYTYWPKFSHALTRNLDPGLVFSEILGVIKGCGEDLSKEDYISNLSHRKSPLLVSARDRVYAIFEAYSKQSRMRNQIDAADRTRTILGAHNSNPLPDDSRVDYIFVDEVQDQLILDIHRTFHVSLLACTLIEIFAEIVLQSLCSNPNGGYWCGDTAQTISVGSSFRIKDLKAFIYEDMLSYRSLDSKRKIPAPFSTFELSVNFRSHGGIVRYAASLVELIYTLFPNSIDHMEPETARTPGPTPLLFVSPNNDESAFVRHLLDSRSANETPFGAHQAIIVRSEATARLEFDDLILYNFFSESEAQTSSWNSLLSLTGEMRNGRIYYDKQTVPPSTSPTLCSELKQLYVAVTRARHRCWLWDSGEVINLTKKFWLNFELIEVASSLQKVAAFAVSSKDLQEWTKRGQEFFSSGLYTLAKSCFERAGQHKEADIADAYCQMSEAKKTQDKNDHLKAAIMMEACARRDGADDSNNVLWYHSAMCFEAAQNIPSASRAYREGKFYDRAALVSFEHQNFDDAILTLLPYSSKMDISTFEKIRDVTRMHYLRTSNYDILRKLFNNDQDACIEYARSSGLSTQLKDLLKESSRFEDLANVHLTEGSPAEASQCLLKSSTHPSTTSRVEKIASDYLWLNLCLDSTPNSKVSQQASQLLNILSSFTATQMESLAFDMNLFKATLGQTTVSLGSLGSADLQQPESKHRLVLGYHHALQVTPWMHDSNCAKGQTQIQIDKKSSRGENLMAEADVDRLIKYELSERLKRRLLALHSDLLDLSCLDLLVVSKTEDSTREPCVNLEAPELEGLTRVAYAATVVLYPIRTRPVESLSASDNKTVRHAWVTRLFSLFNSPAGMIRNEPALSQHPIDQLEQQSLRDWVKEYVWSLKSTRKHPDLLLSTFIMSFSLLYELESRSKSCFKEPWFSNYPRPLVDFGHSAELRSVTADISCLFGHEDRPRVAKSICVLAYIVHNKLKVDIAVLVHLMERVTREAIVAERVAVSSQWLNGISGLIMPLSWARNLVSYHRLSPNMFDAGLIRDLVICIGGVIQRIKDGVIGSLLPWSQLHAHILRSTISAHWKTPSTELWRHSVSSLSVRMYWCIALIIVNLHPAHRALPTALEVLQRGAEDLGNRFECEALRGNEEDNKAETIAAAYNQYTCLPALAQTLRHEELVLLARQDQLYCPAKQKFTSRVITFDSLIDLRQTIFGCPANAEPNIVPQGAENDVVPESPALDDPIPPQGGNLEQTPSIPGSFEMADSRSQAAERIQQWWRRHRDRQYFMESSEISPEAHYYRRFSPLVSKHVSGTSKREKFFQKVLRGPGLLVILSVNMLGGQLDESLYASRSGLQASDLSRKEIEALQKRLKTIEGSRKIVKTLRRALSADSTPEALRAANLSMIKTRFARDVSALFQDVKKFQIIQDTEAFNVAEGFLLRGVDAVKKARVV